jgi:hypothetical protein
MSTQENRPTGGRLRAWFFCPTKKNGPVKTRPFGREARIVTALQKKYSIFRACRPLRLYASMETTPFSVLPLKRS